MTVEEEPEGESRATDSGTGPGDISLAGTMEHIEDDSGAFDSAKDLPGLEELVKGRVDESPDADGGPYGDAREPQKQSATSTLLKDSDEPHEEAVSLPDEVYREKAIREIGVR